MYNLTKIIELEKKLGNFGKGPPPKIEAKKPSIYKGRAPPPPSNKPKPSVGNKPTLPGSVKPEGNPTAAVSAVAPPSFKPNPISSSTPFTNNMSPQPRSGSVSITNKVDDALPRTMTGSALRKTSAERREDKKTVVNGDMKKEGKLPSFELSCFLNSY